MKKINIKFLFQDLYYNTLMFFRHCFRKHKVDPFENVAAIFQQQDPYYVVIKDEFGEEHAQLGFRSNYSQFLIG